MAKTNFAYIILSMIEQGSLVDHLNTVSLPYFISRTAKTKNGYIQSL